tara:strand:- start:280 stop:507 length:228 start_codon:yes stop_codon:yes gene_type:complete
MNKENKLGSYIQKLMTTILDKEEDEFVQQLAWSELQRLNIGIEEFLRKNQQDDSDKVKKTIEKQLLLEEQENGKD